MYEFHSPVLIEESCKYLITKNNGNYFDGTIGFGGHSQEFLNILGPNAKLVGTDKDDIAYEHCKQKFKNENRIVLYKSAFTNIRTISKIEFIDMFDGIFADLGVSSFQLDNKSSGFSYREDSIFDLRMDKSTGISAVEVINTYSEEELANIIYQYGEERKSRQIAKRIIEFRKQKKINTTFDVKKIVGKVIPGYKINQSLSRVFQAFRIFVNNELDELKEFLETSVDLLASGGRIVILSYHSLEDRIVKELFKYESTDCICPPESPVCVCDKERRLKILTKKPEIPKDEEIEKNPRSRSAKLRAAEKI
ncbi:MAG: 16S rRNA (cytosine(1402)-N(4))-methyltransferase RsmH [Melioribacteraceae bacterium]|nr:16S rRNA (cytosine(1402)-N(4))-methyltransferase RsmH [Melioribacteraceae bacterium]MCF8354516.1 16S rRNA (cytosine(1402)-N(4))-methyltransferase RsmH [Melioribacteraceae bacterium]MCF8394285.1 16S rRNA (cytosine(1402)-N(4))-methyltransferase RsmH [Melioribacteraceae bacterium]MCF8418185.1 16S rRNA (cytosine(1402)-N(4))-methyltransferase RsmH [Melioribacteraceae bacterium]